MSTLRRRKRKRKPVHVGAADPSLTGSAGVVCLAELIERLGVVRLLDEGIGSIKSRDRGVTGGQLLVALAQCQLLDGTFLAALDRQREDIAAQSLSAVPAVPARTANSLCRRVGAGQRAGIESATAAVLERGVSLLSPHRRRRLLGEAPTIDMDSTDVEVYGRAKRGVAYNYCGQRAGRPHLATWAQAGVTLAADLLAGNDDVRPRAGDLLRRALAGLPEAVRLRPETGGRVETAESAGPGTRSELAWGPQGAPAVRGRPAVRADAGYFTAELAHAAVEAGCDFAIAAKRNRAMWRAFAGIAETDWVDATGMPGAQVAACDYAPAGWPADSYTIVRRVKVDAEAISADPRSRRRRTIPADQLHLALSGQAVTAYAVSFIVTNIPTVNEPDADADADADADSSDSQGEGEDEREDSGHAHPGGIARFKEVEAWFRRRADIEDRIREAKLGAALRHLPSGDHDVNSVWMWAALLAGTLSVLLQALTGIDEGPRGRAHAARLRHELLRIPARVLTHARGLILRLPPGHQLLPEVLSRLRGLPAYT